MREKRTIQSSIFEVYAEHGIGRELRVMSEWLGRHPELLDSVMTDIGNRGAGEGGRKGLPGEAVLRCAILKQYRGLSYEGLVFCLIDSASCQAFARLPMGWFPQKTTLQQTISAISDSTWERINRKLLRSAKVAKIENGEMVRIDSTVTDAPIHEPSDSTLLWDSVRTLVRLLGQAEEMLEGVKLNYSNHSRRAKRRMWAIQYTRGEAKRAKLYKDLLKVTRKSLSYIEAANKTLKGSSVVGALAYLAWWGEVCHYKPLILKVIDQTERRIIKGEQVPAGDKIFSLFEEHTDIIIKGGREIQYGHKLNLSTGKSGLVLDVVIEAGNPADSARFVPMLERHIENYGKVPRQIAADGGYASQENLREAKQWGVEDVAFHKKRGLEVEDMVRSPWVYRKLRNFRAGIEAGISCLKRAYGLGRCTWKGLEHFKAYVWSSVVAHNLALFGRLQME